MRNEKTDNIFNNRQYLYTVPEKILLDKTLTIHDLRVYMVIRSLMDGQMHECLYNNYVGDKCNIDEKRGLFCINKLLRKDYLSIEEIDGQRYLRIK